MLEETLDLGGEDEIFGAADVIERLLAHAVARQEEDLLVAIPYCEREHSVKVLEGPGAPVAVCVKDHLGVRSRAELDGVGGLQFAAQILMVVYLAVEHDGVAAAVGGHGLMACAEIDDAQPTESECHASIRVKTLIVGTSMLHDGRHSLDNVRTRGRAPAAYADNAAHANSTPCRFRVYSRRRNHCCQRNPNRRGGGRE